MSFQFARRAKQTLLGVFLLTLSLSADAQSFKLLHSFTGGRDGSSPQGSLMLSHGHLFGTANIGGNKDCLGEGCGIIFSLTLAGQQTILHRFVQSDGALPSANLIQDNRGNLYSTVDFGGPYGCDNKGCGGIFRRDAKGKVSLLYAFRGGRDGANPYAGLIFDQAGNLYGAAFAGGTAGGCAASGTQGCGTLFKLDAAGELHVLHVFTGGSDGANPYSALIRDSSGNLYGTASSGGSNNFGTVFKVDARGHFSVLYTFAGGSDGAIPFGGLIRDSAGNLYGTTLGGGGHSAGTVYKLDATGKETILYAFTGGADGQSPWASVLMDENGNLFGTTSFGGANGDGTVFQLDTSGNETVLHSFTFATDGTAIISPVIMDSHGNLFGTADEGGPNGNGTAFEVSP